MPPLSGRAPADHDPVGPMVGGRSARVHLAQPQVRGHVAGVGLRVGGDDAGIALLGQIGGVALVVRTDLEVGVGQRGAVRGEPDDLADRAPVGAQPERGDLRVDVLGEVPPVVGGIEREGR
jgi:hypothetical protein